MDSGKVEVSALIEDAKRKLPGIWAEIESIATSVHPIELLCQLSLMLMHSEDEFPDKEELARWQVKVELISWLLLHHGEDQNSEDLLIDGTVLEPLDKKLDEFLHNYSMSLMEPPQIDQSESDESQLRFMLRTESLNVRGEGVPSQVEFLAVGLYGTHAEWMKANFGFTIEQGFKLARIIFDYVADSLHRRKLMVREKQAETKSYLQDLLDRKASELSEQEKDIVRRIGTKSADEVAQFTAIGEMFSGIRSSMAFAAEDLASCLDADLNMEIVERFLKRMSQTLGSVVEKPDALGFNPLAKFPLVKHEDRYCLPVPPMMYDSLLSTFHFDLVADSAYKDTYDKARGDWLEEQALHVFRGLFVDGEVWWNLEYGPKKARKELDGLVRYDNKLILVECKSKNLTLQARLGNVEAAHLDLADSIQASFKQATRARNFIRGSGSPVNFRASDGTEVTIDPTAITEIFPVSLLGRGGLAVLAANLPALAPVSMFPAGDYPWALSLTDLAVVCELMEFQSQIFDYIRRRDALVRDNRILVHDEWDLLGLYIDGKLDVSVLGIGDAKRVSLVCMDEGLDKYLFSRDNPNLPVVEKPMRKLPPGLREVLHAVEKMDEQGKSDFVTAMLGLPDDFTSRFWMMAEDCQKKSANDLKVHSVTMFHEASSCGVAFVSTCSNSIELERVLPTLCVAKKYRMKATRWLGIGADVDPSNPLLSIALYEESWTHDDDLEELASTVLNDRQDSG